MGVSTACATCAWPSKSCASVGSSTQAEALALEHADPADGVGRRQALVVVDHDRDRRADRLADGAHDREILLHVRVADLRLHAGEAACRPCRGGAGGAGRAVVADRAVDALRPLDAAEQAHQRRVVRPRQGVPQRHVDPGDRHADQALRAEQAEARRERVPAIGGRQRLADDQRGELLDQRRGGGQGGGRVGEYDAVPAHAVAGHDVDEHQRRLGDHAAGGPVGLGHGHAHGPGAELADGRGGGQGRGRHAAHFTSPPPAASAAYVSRPRSRRIASTSARPVGPSATTGASAASRARRATA